MKKQLPDTKHGSLSDIEKWVKSEKDPNLIKRLNAIRLRMLKYPVETIAEISQVKRQSISNWVRQWNHSGKEGLITKSGGSRSKVTEPMRAEISEIIDIKRTINGKVVTGVLLTGYLKKTST
jgi:transposase